MPTNVLNATVLTASGQPVQFTQGGQRLLEQLRTVIGKFRKSLVRRLEITLLIIVKTKIEAAKIW